MTSPTLDPLLNEFARHRPPVIVFNKSHSGSRLLASVLDAAGIHMGGHVNESWDSLDMVPVVEHLVTRYYPDFSQLWRRDVAPDVTLQELLAQAFDSHISRIECGAPWGWKLCETVFILPVVDYCFPGAKFVHLIRDGRDVAFCDHKGPDSAFWRKVYFNCGEIRTHGSLRLSAQAYRRRSHVYNAIHWANSVRIGRTFGAMLRERYREVRYEDLCLNFERTARELLDWLDAPEADTAITRCRGHVTAASIGKFCRHPAHALRRIMDIEKPLLLELGYLHRDPDAGHVRVAVQSAIDRLLDRARQARARWSNALRACARRSA